MLTMKTESKYISKSHLKLIKGPDMCPNCEQGILCPQSDEGMPGYFKCPSCGWFGKLTKEGV